MARIKIGEEIIEADILDIWEVSDKVFGYDPSCRRCGSANVRKHGLYINKNKEKKQCYFCRECRRYFMDKKVYGHKYVGKEALHLK